VGWDIVRRETNQRGGGEGEGAPTRRPWGTPSLTTASRRRPTASAALPLSGAPDARRSAAKYFQYHR
jgi:hypothetical protein